MLGWRQRRRLAPEGGVRGLLPPFPLKETTQMKSKMKIQFHTDHNIAGKEKLAAHVTGVVEDTLSRFNHQITRVEVHLSDQNGDTGAHADKRCVMEVRLEGMQPVAVTHDATSIDQAVDGAANKLKRLLESTLGRLHGHHSH